MSINSHAELTHDNIEELMPGYINGKLNSDLQRRVQEHIAHCKSCFRAQQEAGLLQQLLSQQPEDLKTLLDERRKAANIDRSLVNIDHREPDGCTSSFSPRLKGLSAIYAWIKNGWKVLRSSAAPVQITLLLQSAVVAVTAGLLLWPTAVPPQPYTLYQTQSRSQSLALISAESEAQMAGEYRLYRVVFKPEAEEKSMRKLLLAVDARIYDGPSAMGVYTLIIPATQQATIDILQRLRIDSSVMLAEQAIYRDR